MVEQVFVSLFELSREFQVVPIFIVRWEIFEEFCSLLFDVLFVVFKNIGPLAYVEGARFQPRRYPAFLAERFLMLYFHAKGLRLYGTQILMLEGALRSGLMWISSCAWYISPPLIEYIQLFDKTFAQPIRRTIQFRKSFVLFQQIRDIQMFFVIDSRVLYLVVDA